MSFTEQEKMSRAKGKRKQGLAGDRRHQWALAAQSRVWRWAPGLALGGEGMWAEMTQRRLQEDPTLPVSAGESPRKRSHKEKLP